MPLKKTFPHHIDIDFLVCYYGLTIIIIKVKENYKMKKFIAFLSCLIITATMASCYNNTNDDDMKDHGSTGTTEVPQKYQATTS